MSNVEVVHLEISVMQFVGVCRRVAVVSACTVALFGYHWCPSMAFGYMHIQCSSMTPGTCIHAYVSAKLCSCFFFREDHWSVIMS